jgi:hypothetical protein
MISADPNKCGETNIRKLYIYTIYKKRKKCNYTLIPSCDTEIQFQEKINESLVLSMFILK